MANTYTQIYVQIVFAVKGRQNLITENHREAVEKYICGIIKSNQSKPLAIYCNPNHIHIYPSCSISNMAKDIKANSKKWINEQKLITIASSVNVLLRVLLSSQLLITPPLIN